MDSSNTIYNYRGWSYQPWDDVDTDCIKIWHDFIHEDGRSANCDFNPYEKMSPEDIRFWIDLDMPDRITSSPLSASHLNTIWQKKNIS
jgi:hypothetical protein